MQITRVWGLGLNIGMVEILIFAGLQHLHAVDSLQPHFHPLMVTFSKVERKDPSHFFWYMIGHASSPSLCDRSTNRNVVNNAGISQPSLCDRPANRNVVDNAGISQQEFAYFVDCHPIILIYRSTQHVCTEVYRLARICR